MTQQLDPKQVRGLKEELDTLDSMVKIKSIGANLSLDADGELSATGGGGGGGGVNLYSTLGNNIDGALTQKASTDLLVHAKPDGVNDLIANNKITLGYLPDSVLGQVVYGGGFVPSTAVATLTTNAQEKLGTSDATITLTNDTTAITGYEANEGIYYIATASGTFASISFETGDWLISIGTAWSKVDNTDAVTGVKGNEEVNYRLGNVNITAQNVGAVTSDNAISTQDITPFITTSMINDSAITTAKIDDGAITTAKIANGAVTSNNIDFTTFPDTTLTLSGVSPIAGIVDYSSSFPFSCHKNKAGVVQLYLAIKNSSGSSISAYTSLLQLPVGYRPVARIHQLIKSDGTTVEILTNGYLQLSGALADSGGVNTTLCFLTS